MNDDIVKTDSYAEPGYCGAESNCCDTATVGYSTVMFDYEMSLWDNIVLELVRQGYQGKSAARQASEVIEARNARFNTETK